MLKAPMVIHLRIDRAEPLKGTAAAGRRDPMPFEGWIELLAVVAELVRSGPTRGEPPAGAGRPTPEEGGAG
jgi:hypothetical protein